MYFMCFLSSEGEPQARFEVHAQRLDGPDRARLVAVEVVAEGGVEVNAHVRGELEFEADADAGGELQAFRLLVEMDVPGAVVDEEMVVSPMPSSRTWKFQLPVFTMLKNTFTGMPI